MIRSYDLIAARYDRMHRRWLKHAGGEAQAALEASLVSRINPGDRVLDAGCGTGALAHSLTQHQTGLSLTLLDSCEQMLAQARDVKGTRVCGSLLDMPFDDDAFDVVVAAWAIEATGDECTAISELMRVVRPGGHVLVAFCATEPPHSLTASLLRKGVELRRTGRFLETRAIEDAMRSNGADLIIRHRCHGPAAVLDARRADTLDFAIAA